MKRSACESENVGPWAPPALTQGEVNQVAATSENSQPMPDWTDLKGETSVGRSAAMLRHAFVGDPWVLKLCTPQEIIHTQHWFQAAKVLRRVEISVFLAVSTWSAATKEKHPPLLGGSPVYLVTYWPRWPKLRHVWRAPQRIRHQRKHEKTSLQKPCNIATTERPSWEDSRKLENGKWTIS